METRIITRNTHVYNLVVLPVSEAGINKVENFVQFWI